MRRPTLRSQLNQIRLWLRQGRTDAWIAHKLDIEVATLEQFKRDNKLDEAPPTPATAPPEPVEFAPPTPFAREEPKEEEDEEDELEREPEPVEAAPEPAAPRAEAWREPGAVGVREPAATEPEEDETAPSVADRATESEPEETDEKPRRRRRGRRGGRRRRGKSARYEATFDHGEEGYGLRLDPAVATNPVYEKHWAGHRTVAVTVEPDAITVRRVETEEQEAPED